MNGQDPNPMEGPASRPVGFMPNVQPVDAYNDSDIINGAAYYLSAIAPIQPANMAPTADLAMINEVRRQNPGVPIFDRPPVVKSALLAANTPVAVSVPSGAKYMIAMGPSTVNAGVSASAFLSFFGNAFPGAFNDSDTSGVILLSSQPMGFLVNGLMSFTVNADAPVYVSFMFYW
jgi:hypothetical protein